MAFEDLAFANHRPSLENLADPHWRHPAEVMEPDPADDGDDLHRAQVEVIVKLLETLWCSGQPGGNARGKQPRRPLGAARLHEAVQRAAMRLCALSWLVCPGAVCRDAITLSDLAACLGVSRAMMSRLHVTWGEFLGGLRGEGGRSDSARRQARISRLRAIESGRGVGLRSHDGGATGDSFAQRDRLDEDAARRGLAKLGRAHTPDSDRCDRRAKTGCAVVDDLRATERHALQRRGWIGSDDVLTPAGVEALRELEVEVEG